MNPNACETECSEAGITRAVLVYRQEGDLGRMLSPVQISEVTLGVRQFASFAPS